MSCSLSSIHCCISCVYSCSMLHYSSCLYIKYRGMPVYAPKLLFMKRLFWNAIHHLLGLPVPSA